MAKVYALDTETRGLKAAAVEVAVVGEGVKYTTLIKSPGVTEPEALKVHGITDEMIAKEGREEVDVVEMLLSILKDGDIVIAHNASFDIGKVEAMFARVGKAMPKVSWVDTLAMARKLLPKPKVENHRLATLITYFGLTGGGHRALADAEAALQLYHKLVELELLKVDNTYKYVATSNPVLANLEARKPYIRREGAAIVWGAEYEKKDKVLGSLVEFKEFRVVAVDFKNEWFVVVDITKDEERCYKFNRFVNTDIADLIIKMLVF